MERGFVLKANVNCMVLAGGEDLHKVHGLAIEFVEAVEGAPPVAANGGLAAFGFGEAQGGWEASWFLCFGCFADGRLRARRRAFLSIRSSFAPIHADLVGAGR